jgi:hypothetical protein
MKAGIPDEYMLKQSLKTIKMKNMKFTLLTVLLVFLAQATIAQVLITDDAATFPTANPNAVLDLKSDFKPLILPVLPIENYLDLDPVTGGTPPAYGMICVTKDTGSPPFTDFFKLQFYWDLPGTGEDGWKAILTERSYLSALRDVKRTGAVIRTSYYIGEGAGGPVGAQTEYNTVVGYKAGNSLNSSESNTFLGYEAGGNHAISDDQSGAGGNTAIGAQSGIALTTGYGNTFLGIAADALADGTIYFSTAIGSEAKTDGVKSTALGYNATTNGANSTAIGAEAVTTGANQVVLGTAAESVFI